MTYNPRSFSLEAVSNAMDRVAREIVIPSPEIAALVTCAEAQLFIFAPPPGFVSPEGRLLVSRDELINDMERGHKFMEALGPWVEKVRRGASPEQLQFLRDLGLDGGPVNEEHTPMTRSVRLGGGEEDGEEVDEHRRWANEATVPEPEHAAKLLKGMLARYAPRSAAHACIELALTTLLFIIETDQVASFLTFLDDIGRAHTAMSTPGGSNQSAG